jgi:hypothetical protein
VPALSLADLEAFDLRPAGAGRERRFCCPLPACRDKPRDRAHQSLCVNVETGLYLCNRCQARGKLTERWERRSVQQIRWAQARARFALPPERQPGTAASAPLLPVQLARCRPVAGTPGEGYLFERGIGREIATAAGVLYTRDCYGRPGVVFPMRDHAGELVAVNVRHTDGRADPKTHSLGDRSLGVFATPGALAVARRVPLVVVEGPMDALSLAECDVPAVALVCTRAPGWFRSAAAFQRVLVGLDADAEGDAKSELLMGELAPFARSVERLRPPVGKDWNDALLAGYADLCDWLEAAGLAAA